jgi:A/G-specific adenine glycosylase
LYFLFECAITLIAFEATLKLMEALSLWYQKIARPLPWRENHDPYRIWISEVMLQQTQVETVLFYYHRFLKRFPTLKSLAESQEQEVLTLWSGLGYYRRARNLRKGAQYLFSLRGEFPRTREEILAVPGIGPYTAGAILSIAFDLPEALVDGNVQRVFARYFGFREPIQSSKAQKFFWAKADLWVKTAVSPRIHNQALMELGSLI